MLHKTSLIISLLLIISSAFSQIIYVVNSQSRTLSRIDTENGTVNNSFALLGNVPNKIAAEEDLLWVVNSGDNAIQKLSANTGATLGNIFLGNSVNPWDAIRHQNQLYVSGLFSNKVYRLDVSSGTVTGNVSVGYAPEGLHITNNKLYVTNTGDYSQNYLGSSVSVIDLDSFSVIKTIPMHANPQYLSSLGDYLHVSCTGNWTDLGGAVCILDTNTDELVHTIELGGTPGNIYFASSEQAIVSDAGGVYLYSYHPQSFEIIHGAANPIAGGGSDICGNPSQIAVLTPNWSGNGTIKIFDSNLSLIREYTVAMMPTDIKMAPTQSSNSDLVIQANPIQIYPNPLKANDKLRISSSSPIQAQIELYNLKGQKVGSHFVQNHSYIQLNLPNGIYLYTIREGKQKARQGKLIIMN